MNEELLVEWAATKAEVTRLQKKERELRAEITKSMLGSKLEGSISDKTEVYKVTATAVLNRALDQAVLETLWDGLSWEEQQCVEYKPKLIAGKYKEFEKLDSKLNEAVTVKPGMAQLKMEVL